MKVPAVLLLSAALAAAQSQSTTQPAPEASVPTHWAAAVAAELAEKKVPAVYPEKARAEGIQGAVVLRVLVTESGDVREATVVSGAAELTQACVDAMKQWKYKPYTVSGKPAPFETQVTFGFHFHAPSPPPPPGRFRDGQYQNDFFGISYPLSSEWVRETKLMQSRFASQNASPSPLVLLAALHVPSQSDGLVADSSFLLVAAPQPAQGAAKDYLKSIVTALGAEKMAKPRGDITPISIAGLTADFKPSGVGAQYESIVCTIVKGSVLRWNFLAESESALEDAVATVAAISHVDLSPPQGSPEKQQAPVSASQVVPVAINMVRVSSGVAAGLLLKRVEPRYPPDAKYAHIQGTVLLACGDRPRWERD